MKEFTRLIHPFCLNEDWLLALDPAYNKTGYAIFKNGKLHGWGVIDVSGEATHTDKQMEFGLLLGNILQAISPNLVAVEQFLWATRGGNAKGMQNLLKMRGIMDFVLGKRRRIEYHNSTWKKRLTGNFRASKEEILAEVNRRFKLKLTEDEQDMADAIGIGAVAYGDQKTN